MGIKVQILFSKRLGAEARQFLAARVDIRWQFGLQGKLGQCLGFAQFKAADHVFYVRNDWRRGAQFIHAETDQQRHKDGIACNFTAHARPNAVPMRRVNGRLDKTDNGRMRRLVDLETFSFVRSAARVY